MKRRFQRIKFTQPTLYIIDKCNVVLKKYAEAGYDMTLRQLYYQLVSAGEIPNNAKEYNRLGTIVSNGRMAGLIDWNHIVDRTRALKGLGHWDDPAEIIRTAASSFRVDKWAMQEYRPEVWIEKDALAGVFDRICTEMDVPFFSCRGYTSLSEMFGAARRFKRYEEQKKIPVIFHFGDHDPSGIDMSRDIQDRLLGFEVTLLEFDRLALNMPQVEVHNPPPNPAKLTDSRCDGYIRKFGNESWELDALPPEVLSQLVRDAVTQLINVPLWDATLESEKIQRETLTKISDHFDDVEYFVQNL